MRRPLAIVALVLGTAACGEDDVELREWRPSDHQQASAPAETREAPPEQRDADPEATERRAATALFRAMCASCHGESGAGDGPGRPPAAPVTDLTSPEWQGARTDEEIAQAIAAGRGGFMPAFGDRLSPPGIAALVRHVRRLSGGVGPGPGAGPGPGPGAGAGAGPGAGPGSGAGPGPGPGPEAGTVPAGAP